MTCEFLDTNIYYCLIVTYVEFNAFPKLNPSVTSTQEKKNEISITLFHSI